MGDKLQRDYYNNYGENKLWIDWYNNEYENLKKIKIIEYTQEPNDIIYILYNYSHTIFNNINKLLITGNCNRNNIK